VLRTPGKKKKKKRKWSPTRAEGEIVKLKLKIFQDTTKKEKREKEGTIEMIPNQIMALYNKNKT